MYAEIIVFAIFMISMAVIIFIMMNKKPKACDQEGMTAVTTQKDEPTKPSTKPDPELQDQIDQIMSIQENVLRKSAQTMQKL